MEVKTSTKEKFHVITVEEPHLSAHMTEELCNELATYLVHPIKNIVLRLPATQTIDEGGAERLVSVQQRFYESGASFVICELTGALEKYLDEIDLLELMNVTPTQSEAWDIVQMEEIERELLGDSPLPEDRDDS